MPSAMILKPAAVRPLVAVPGIVATHTPSADSTAARVVVELSGYVTATLTAVIDQLPQFLGTPRMRTVDGEPVKVVASTSGSSGCAALSRMSIGRIMA